MATPKFTEEELRAAARLFQDAADQAAAGNQKGVLAVLERDPDLIAKVAVTVSTPPTTNNRQVL